MGKPISCADKAQSKHAMVEIQKSVQTNFQNATQ